MWTISMAYSDRLIIQSIRDLQGREITVHQIAEHAAVPYGTAKRALSRLERSGQIVWVGPGRRWGASYQVKETA